MLCTTLYLRYCTHKSTQTIRNIFAWSRLRFVACASCILLSFTIINFIFVNIITAITINNILTIRSTWSSSVTNIIIYLNCFFYKIVLTVLRILCVCCRWLCRCTLICLVIIFLGIDLWWLWVKILLLITLCLWQRWKRYKFCKLRWWLFAF